MLFKKIDFRSPLGTAVIFWSIFSSVCLSAIYVATAQEPPDRRYLFEEDSKEKERAQDEREAIKKKKHHYQASEKEGQLPFDVGATNMQFSSNGNELIADGGVILTYSSFVLEAAKAIINVSSNQVDLSGDVRITDVGTSMTADSAHVDIKTGHGTLDNADINFSPGDFRLKAAHAERQEGEQYDLTDTILTTCKCAQETNCPPWRIRADSASIVREGYGQAWGATLDLYNIPIFYTPYLIFPAKAERQSGFLPGTFGGGRRSGVDVALPFYWAVDESTDATITGIYESEIRSGTSVELRKIFSLNHRLETGLTYLNESQRGGALLGTNIDGLADPSLTVNRFGGYANDSWRGEVADVPLQFLLRGKYVGDDLFVREYENDKIAKYNSRFVTSRAVLRAPLGSTFSMDLSSEYNQSLIDDDRLVLQRLPELQINGVNIFHPFGDNQLGLKVVATSKATVTDFIRDVSYDGLRSEAYQAAKLPFHYRNYFDASVEGYVRATKYNLMDNDDVSLVPSTVEGEEASERVDGELKSKSDRLVPGINAKLDTAFERVFQVEDSDWFKQVGELGQLGRDEELKRLKHTFEPGLRYKYVPKVDQDDNPVFDSNDQLPRRNVLTYQLVQRLYARYEPRNPYVYGIEEVTPEPTDLASLREQSPLDREFVFGFDDVDQASDFQKLRSGSVREVVRFKLAQSYNIYEANRSIDDEENDVRDPFSDVNADLLTFPNEYIALRTKADFDAEESQFSQYSLEAQLHDKRGDQVRSRLNFVDSSDEPRRQLETGAEVKISERLKVGYYSRYDDISRSFIESKVGLRFLSSCKCWILDLNYTDRTNPDDTKISFDVTLIGMGELNQRFFNNAPDDRATTTTR